MRERVTYLLTAGAGVNYGSSASGLQIGKYLDSNSIIGAGVYSFNTTASVSASSSVDEDSDLSDDQADDIDEIMLNGTAVELTFQRFTSNSFYFKPTIFYRNASSKDSMKATYINGSRVKKEYSGKATFQDVGAGIKIGNQWQWDNFTLGCDWVGYSAKLFNINFEGDESEYASRAVLSLLNLHLGISF